MLQSTLYYTYLIRSTPHHHLHCHHVIEQSSWIHTQIHHVQYKSLINFELIYLPFSHGEAPVILSSFYVLWIVFFYWKFVQSSNHTAKPLLFYPPSMFCGSYSFIDWSLRSFHNRSNPKIVIWNFYAPFFDFFCSHFWRVRVCLIIQELSTMIVRKILKIK